MTTAEFVAAVAETSGMKRADVRAVLDAVAAVVVEDLRRRRRSLLPGLFTVRLRKVAAVRGGEVKTHNVTKKRYVTRDKPAYNVVSARPLKALTDAVGPDDGDD